VITEQSEDNARIIIVKPNKSATWRTNLYALIAISIPSLGAAIGFALLGAWPILPFAGAELMALAGALYYVSWNLEYRQIVTVSEQFIRVEKGYFVPKRTWLWARSETAVNVISPKNKWEGPQLWLHNRESRTAIGRVSQQRRVRRLIKAIACRITG